MLMTYYTDNILYNKGIKQLPHFENLLHTFAMQYKIKVQGNCETVCLLSKLHEAKHHVNVRLDMDELDLTAAESKATYEEIRKYVAEHYDGMKVSNLYIAQVKRKCGIELAENFNIPRSEGAKQPQCPKEKEEAIIGALKAFQMI